MSALDNNKLKKYLFYAVGEIILVVIGIVIGLQLNKANDKQIQQNKIENYYTRINEEVVFANKLIANNSNYSDSLIKGIKYCLKSMVHKKADSSFIKNLTFLSDNEQQTLFFPVIDEFLEQGYLSSVNDVSLKEQFHSLEYFRKQSDIDDSKLQSFSENLLLPKLVDKLNVLDIDFMNYESSRFQFQKLEYDTDFENNYDELINDLTIWNLLIYRMNIEKSRIINNKSLQNILERISEKTKSKANNETQT